MNKSATLMFVLPLALLAGPPSSPQQDMPKTKVSQLTLEAQAYSVTSLIDLSAEFLGRNYLIQPSQGNCAPESQMIRLQNRLLLAKEDCEGVVAQLLSTYDWELSPLDPEHGIYEWLNKRNFGYTNKERRTLWLSPEEILARSNRRIQVKTSLVLKHLDPDSISNRFRNISGNNGVHVSPLTNYRVSGDSVTVGGTLLVSGMCDQVAQTLRLLKGADQERSRAANSLESQLRAVKTRVQALEKAIAGKQ